MTLLLVRGWRGAVGDDIDTNNDGIIDNPLWDVIWDSVGVLDDGAPGFAYGQTNLAANFDGISNFGQVGRHGFPTDRITTWYLDGGETHLTIRSMHRWSGSI